MLDPNLTLDLDPIDLDAWRAKVDADPRGRPYDKLVTALIEGFPLAPLHTAADAPDAAAQAAIVRASVDPARAAIGWDVRTRYEQADPRAANAAIRADLDGGARSLWLVLDPAVALGGQPTGRGVAVRDLADLEATLDAVELDNLPVILDAGAAAPNAASLLATVWRRRGTGAAARGAFGVDPLGALARDGFLPEPIDDALARGAKLAIYTRADLPGVRALAVDVTPWHEAGADAAQELAFAVATTLTWLRAADTAGFSPAGVAGQLGLRVGLGCDFLLEISKLRALRLLLARVLGVCGAADAASKLHVHAVGGDRALSRHDAANNLLRGTAMGFAAAVGGADAVTLPAADRLTDADAPLSRRVARNIQHVLAREAQLGRVIDPAGGSWSVERLTRDLAERAWIIFQHIERAGGMASALTSGFAADLVAASAGERERALARGKRALTGVSAYPDPTEAPPPPEPGAGSLVAALAETPEGAVTLPPLPSRRSAEPFEALRDASDAWLAEHGARPRIAILTVGPLAEHDARTTWVANFFGVAGLDAVRLDDIEGDDDARAAFTASGAAVACISAADARYPAAVPRLAAAARAAGAHGVWVAGRPAEQEAAWRAAGVDGFAYIGCDIVATLTAVLKAAGVAR